MSDAAFESLYYTSRDGLRLHARHYPAPGANARPLVCLPGLTRNSRDFHRLALAFSQDAASPREVYALDFRGRGLSAHDSEWRNYTPHSEMHDVIDFLIVHELFGVAVLGTSRGGLVAMALAAALPNAVGAVILNDIGPVIERDGLARIAGYAGRVPLPGSWAEAARMVREMNTRQFPAVPEPLWEEVARALFNDHEGRPAPGYDPKIAASLSVLDGPLPELWPQFQSLARIPVMVLRGENSDILSEATAEEMRRRHPGLVLYTVKGQGHAPLLMDEAAIAAVKGFLESAGTPE